MSKTVLRIISFVFIVLWGLAFFVGFNYVQAGDYGISAIVTVISMIFMGGVFYFMLRLNRAPIDALGVKGSHTLMCVLISLYAVISLFMALFINHMGVVSFTDKTVIQDKAKQEIEELRTTFYYNENENPRRNSYYEWVTEQLAIYRDRQTNSRSISVETDVDYMEDALVSKSGFISLHDVVNSRLDQIWKAVDTWNIFTVVHEVKSLENNKTEWEEAVELCSQYVDPPIGDESFKCSSKYNYDDLLDSIVYLSTTLSWLAILIMLIMQFFILLSFFASRPKGHRVTGFKLITAERKGRIKKGEISIWNSTEEGE